MFSHLRLTLLLSGLAIILAVSASAITTTVTVTTPFWPGPTIIPASQCNTGPIQCCNSVSPANGGQASVLLGLLGVVVTDPYTLVGLTCTPITVVGIGGGTCSAQPLCCQYPSNNFRGIVAIGCVPVDING
ncbi:fungal hydrophobin [Pluteus cervinus]|uniref:Fungal hydrophobin n=1 Tax=Pluteus cervinus TaxID=181527 RepID=A0ACD3AE77_9AGAR|nr:fungal hydrophobin [Pluteus cervinus]